ncbi:MAG: hypothetical protein HY909_29460 [Deltaproteobacteria bacterium]|nr:hypothetical protein [Deltaproteobacteria bacterium]
MRALAAVAVALSAGCTVAFGWDPAALPSAATAQDAGPDGDAPLDVPGDASDGASDGATDQPDTCNGLLGTRLHCGACGRACPGATVCQSDQCVPGCRAGLTPCGGMCVDVQSSNQHCGACGVDCAMGTPRCCRGVCVARCN